MRRKKAHGFVYMIQCNEHIKIGIAHNVRRRLDALQTSNPYKLKLLKAFPSQNPSKDENRLHRCLHAYHTRGEWHTIPQATLDTLLFLDDLSILIGIKHDTSKH